MFLFVSLGSEEVKTVAAQIPDTQENRWQHPEKQKTLIHTAPVLSPTLPAALASSSSAGSAIRAVRGRGRDDALKNSREVRMTLIHDILFRLSLTLHWDPL